MSCVLGIGDTKLIASLALSMFPKLTNEMCGSSIVSVAGIGVIDVSDLFLYFCVVVRRQTNDLHLRLGPVLAYRPDSDTPV